MRPVTFPATPLEALVAETQHDRWPAVIHAELALDGRLDGDRLARGVAAVTERHPLVGARLRPAVGYRRLPSWVIDENDGVAVDVVAAPDYEGRRATMLSGPVDLSEHPPVRIVHAVGTSGASDGDRLGVFVHHAALDGLATAQLLGALADGYAGRPQPPGDGIAERARRPSTRGAPRSSPATGLLGGALRREQWARMQAVRRSGGADLGDADDDVAGSGVAVDEVVGADVVLDAWPDWLCERVLFRRPPGVTVNDVMVAATHVACRRWNTVADERPISVAVPVDVWNGDGPRPFTNVTLQGVTVTRPDEHRDLVSLLASVCEQGQGIKASATSDHSGMIRLATSLPSALRRAALRGLRRVASDRFVTTARCSNLGLLPRPDFGPDGPRVRAMWFSPPTRPPAGLGFGVVGDGGVLRITVRRCAPAIDAAGGERCARLLREAADELIEAASSDRLSSGAASGYGYQR